MSNQIFSLLFSLVLIFYSSSSFGQVQLISSGSANNFAITYPANITALNAGFMVTFFSNQSISGPSFLTLNSFGPNPILKNVNQTLTAGEIQNGQPVTVIYDGFNWQLLSTLFIGTVTNLWTVSGSNLQPTVNSYGVNLSTTSS
ncbi:MAG: hypothetical protein K2Q22_04105, partial [Cytophagales bacterium]|nr:hypothetical protein [Cytophagales bacterium]